MYMYEWHEMTTIQMLKQAAMNNMCYPYNEFLFIVQVKENKVLQVMLYFSVLLILIFFYGDFIGCGVQFFFKCHNLNSFCRVGNGMGLKFIKFHNSN